MEEFLRLNQEGTTILMVTHDSKVAAKCGRILYLLDGSIKGELSLRGMTKEKEKEEKVNRWLAEMGW
jgi:putative ABC transport system ATP-binding protein